MKKSFFDSLAIASMERMHSQMIAWILSQDCHAYSPAQKLQILRQLAEDQRIRCEGELEVETELRHLDLVVKADNRIVIIENKIKSSQGVGQLLRYDDIIANHLEDSGRPRKVLLSLIGETPRQRAWIPKRYSDLEKALRAEKLAKGRADSTVVLEYIASLGRLIEAVEEFTENPHRFPHVFTGGSLKRSEKRARRGPELDVIGEMQLETALQRWYLEQVRKSLKAECSFDGIGETRGVAFLDVKDPQACGLLRSGGHEFHWGIQFQGDTLKVQLEAGWLDRDSPRPVSRGMRDQLINVLLPRMSAFLAERDNEGEWRLNSPKKSSKTVYCSLSRRIDPGSDDPVWSRPLPKASRVNRRAYGEAIGMAKQLSEYLERNRCARARELVTGS